jgi:lambda repressor-like predicted transcriptional regulator
MNANQIKGNLLINGVSVAEIARELGVSRQAVYQTISGTIRSPKIMEFIAGVIGKQASEIWPDDKTNQEEAA